MLSLTSGLDTVSNEKQTNQCIYMKMFFLFWYPASDRARRADANALILTSRGPLHSLFLCFLIVFIMGFTVLAPYGITKVRCY